MISTKAKPIVVELSPTINEVSVNQPVLFLDDRFISEQIGLKRHMGGLVKWPGNPIFKPRFPWEGRCTIIWGSVLWDATEGLFKMWYEAYNPIDPHPCHRICYATSNDGIDWDRPSLGLIEWQGSRDNNMVHIGDDTIDSATVAIDPFDAPPEQRYKMMLYDHSHRALVRMASPDGMRWRHLGPVSLRGSVGDRHSMLADCQQGKWVVYHRESSPVRTVCMSTSDDFEHWTQHGEVLRASKTIDPPETELYGLIGFREQGVGLGFLEMFHTLERRLDTQLVRLDDEGRPSRFMPHQPLLNRGEWGEWDSTWVCPGNCAPVRVGEELRIYYQGRRTLHWSDPPNGTGHIGAIGMARLRPHGWAYLEPTGDTGTLTTVSLRVVGRSLCVNADARNGEVRAELIDERDQPLPGYGVADCHPLTSDATFFKMAFRGKTNLKLLSGMPVRIRLHLKKARLYSFWFYEGP